MPKVGLTRALAKCEAYTHKVRLANVFLQVIVTSYLFPDAKFSLERLQKLSSIVGKDKLVVDVRYSNFMPANCVYLTQRDSCRRRGDKWWVAMNKWQDITDMEVSQGCNRMFTDSLVLTFYREFGDAINILQVWQPPSRLDLYAMIHLQ